MNSEAKVELLRERFISRDTAYATMWYNPEKGVGYVRALDRLCDQNPPCTNKFCVHATNLPITDNLLLRHLQGKTTIGTYQLKEDNTVRWICLDVDVMRKAPKKDYSQELKDQVISLVTTIHKNIGPNSCLVERSGSKGYHIWVFLEPTQARYAKSLGYWIVQQSSPLTWLSIEVFPKQNEGFAYGNLVKIPLGIHLKTHARCFFVDNKFEDHADQWDKLSQVRVLTEQEVKSFLTEHDVEEEVLITNDNSRIALPCMTRIMDEGLGDGNRDVGLFRLAVYLNNRGLSEDMTSAALARLNESKLNPPLPTQVVEAKVSSAYAQPYSPFPCSDSGIDSFCSSSCRYFESKLKNRWTRYGREPKEAIGVISRD